jgi:hypothetical protein
MPNLDVTSLKVNNPPPGNQVQSGTNNSFDIGGTNFPTNLSNSNITWSATIGSNVQGTATTSSISSNSATKITGKFSYSPSAGATGGQGSLLVTITDPNSPGNHDSFSVQATFPPGPTP